MPPDQMASATGVEEMRRLVGALVPRLLQGTHPAYAVLRQQFAAASVSVTAETNWGFYADFQFSEEMPRVEPPDFCGGDAEIKVEGVKNGATCVLYVMGGRLSFLEVATYDEPWIDPPKFLDVSNVRPLAIGENQPRPA
jgi:hypothetical protein